MITKMKVFVGQLSRVNALQEEVNDWLGSIRVGFLYPVSQPTVTAIPSPAGETQVLISFLYYDRSEAGDAKPSEAQDKPKKPRGGK